MTRALLLAFLAIVACRDDEPPPPPAEVATQSMPLAPREPAVVAVEDAGAEPRLRLRLRPAAPQEDPMRLELRLQMTLHADGQAIPPVAMPVVIVHGRLAVDSADADRIVARHLVDRVETQDAEGVPASLRDDLSRAIAALESYRAKLELDPRGTSMSGVVDVPTGVEGPVQQLLQQMSESLADVQVPLPEEAVGVGARWTATEAIDQSGMQLTQTTTYVVEAIEGATVRVRSETKQTLRNRELATDLAPGARATVRRFSATGTGEATLDLGHVVPTHSTQHTEVHMVLDATAMGQTSRQEIRLVTDAAIAREP